MVAKKHDEKRASILQESQQASSQISQQVAYVVSLPCPPRLQLGLLQHLDQGVGDGHPWESLLASMGTGLRVSSQTSHQRQIQIELLHQPVLRRCRPRTRGRLLRPNSIVHLVAFIPFNNRVRGFSKQLIDLRQASTSAALLTHSSLICQSSGVIHGFPC